MSALSGHESRTTWRVVAALVGLAVSVGAFHEAWCREDARVPFMDQHRYYAMSVKAASVFDGTHEDGVTGLLHLHPSHPPLYPIVGALGMLVGERDFPSARRVNVVLAALLVFATFALARTVAGPWTSWTASALAAWAPLVTSFGHVYYIEALLVLLVLWSLRAVVRDETLARTGGAVWLGILLGLGCLAKWTFPVFLFAPLIVAVGRRGHWKGFGVACLAATAVAGPWYALNLGGIIDFFGRGVTGGEGYLSARSGLDGATYYPREIVLVGLGLPLSLAAAVGTLIVLGRRSREGVLLVLAVVAPVLVFSLVMTKKPRHLIPLLPVLAIFGAVAVAAIRARGPRIAVGSFLVLHVVASSFQASFGVLETPPGIPIGERRLPLLSQGSPIPGTPDGRHWPYPDILRALVDHGANDDTPVLLLCNLTAFREDGFWFWRDELGLEVTLGLVPFSYPAAHPAFEPLPLEPVADDTPGLLDARYVVAKSGICWIRYPTGLKLHHYAGWISEALIDPDGALRGLFDPIGDWPLPDGSRAQAFRVRDSADEKLQAIARWALRFQPTSKAAWGVLGEPVPPDLGHRDRRLVELRVRPEILATVDATTLTGALYAHPLREDLWRLALERVPDAPVGREAAKVLDLIEASRIRERSPDAPLDLARHHLGRGHRAAAIRWLRRALEANADAADAVRSVLAEAGVDAPSAGSLLEHLRRLDAP